MSYIGTTLDKLIIVLNELCSRLTSIAGAKQTSNESLRATILTGSTTAVTGTLTGVTTITNLGTGYSAYVVSVAQSNQLAIQSNIQNVVV